MDPLDAVLRIRFGAFLLTPSSTVAFFAGVLAAKTLIN
jgi:hypothetical protein